MPQRGLRPHRLGLRRNVVVDGFGNGLHATYYLWMQLYVFINNNFTSMPPRSSHQFHGPSDGESALSTPPQSGEERRTAPEHDLRARLPPDLRLQTPTPGERLRP